MSTMPMLRLLVTGSRDWSDPKLLHKELFKEYYDAAYLGCGLLVVHGFARRGADTMTDTWAIVTSRDGFNVDKERHPADWDAPCRESCKPGHRQSWADGRGDYCPAQGSYRNQEMVDLGFWRAIAFLQHSRSKSTLDCIRRIKQAGRESDLRVVRPAR